MSGSGAAMKFLDVVRATLRTIFRPRFELRVPPFFFDLRFVAKSFADYAECDGFGKAKFTFPVFRQFSGNAQTSVVCRLREVSRQAAEMNRLAACAPQNRTRSCASHVSAGPSVDLNRFAFLDEKRHVNGLTSFELCRLGDVAGSIAANAFG